MHIEVQWIFSKRFENKTITGFYEKERIRYIRKMKTTQQMC